MSKDVKVIEAKIVNNIEYKVSGEEKIRSIIDTLTNMTNGKDYEKYWTSQEALIQETVQSLEKFQNAEMRGKEVTSEMASELLKNANALQAVSNGAKLTEFRGLENINESLSKATTLAGDMASAFSVSNFQGAFSLFQTLSDNRVDMEKFFAIFQQGVDISAFEQLKTKLSEVTKELVWSKREIESLENSLDKLNNSDVGELQDKLETTANKARRTFETFLESNNLTNWSSDYDYNSFVDNLFDEIKEGSISAEEAITSFKEQYGYLLNTVREASSSFISNESVEDSIGKIGQLETKLDELSVKISGMQAGGTEASPSGGIFDPEYIQRITDVFKEFISGLQSTGDVNSSLLEIFRTLNAFAGLSEDQTRGLSSFIYNLNKLGETKIGKATVSNFTTLFAGLSNLKNAQNLAFISNVDLSKFNELKVSKSSLSNLAEYLPKIADVNVGAVKNLAGIDFSKLNSLKIDKGSVSALESLSKINPDVINVNDLISKSIGEETDNVGESGNAAAEGIRAEQAALENVQVVKDSVAKKESEVALATESLGDAAEETSGDIREEYETLKLEDGLFAKRTTKYSNNGLPISRNTTYKDSKGVSHTKYERYEDEAWIDEGSSVTSSRIQEYNRITKELDEAYRQRQIVQEKVNKLKFEIDTKGDDGGFRQREIDSLTNGSMGLDEINTWIERLHTARQAYSDLDESTGKADAQQRKLAESARNAAAKQEEYARKTAEAQKKSEERLKKSTLIEGSEKYNRYYAQIQNWLTKITKAQEDWSRAAGGESDDKYRSLEKYREDLEALSSEMNNMPESEVRQRLSNIAKGFSEAGYEIKKTGEDGMSFTTVLSKMGRAFSDLISPARIAMATMRQMREAVRSAIELQDAFVDLQIVTRASDEAMAAYSSRVTQTASALGSSVKDVVAATTTYSRLGYSLDDSDVLAKYTAMLEKVGNIDPESAQNSITALLAAFPDEVNIDNIESTMDKLVTVGNNFPISVAQIAEGMNNASSSLAAAGNSFDESVALLMGANVTVQNASKASTALRTISARIYKTESDLNELGESIEESKYEAMINGLTKHNVTLVDEIGNYRSLIDILRDVSKVWDQMDSMERSAFIEAAGGTRGRDILLSIINNFDKVDESILRMQDSGGALADAYGVYLDSITAHIESFKSALAGLGSEVLTPLTDLINSLIDFGALFVKVLGTIIGTMDKLGGLETWIVAFTGLTAASKINKLTSGLGDITKTVSNMHGPVAGIIKLFTKFGKEGSSAADNVGTSLLKTAGSAKTVVSVVSALVAAYSLIRNIQASIRESRNSVISNGGESVDNAREIYDVYSSYVSARSNIDGTTESTEALSDATKKLADALGLEKDALNQTEEGFKNLTASQLDKARRDAKDATAAAMSSVLNYRDWDETHMKVPSNVIDFYARNNGYYAAKTDQERLLTIVKSLDDMYARRSVLQDKGDKTFFEQQEYKNLIPAIELLEKRIDSYTGAMTDEIYVAEKYNNVLSDTVEITENAAIEAVDGHTASITSFADSLKGAVAALDEYNKALEGGEKGDLAAQYADAYNKFAEDWDSGKTDTNAVRAAIELFIPDDVQRDLNYDAQALGEMLNSGVFKAMFGTKGENDPKNYAQNFIEYIKSGMQTISGLSDVVTLTGDSDQFSFTYDSLSELASVLGLTTDSLSVLLDALDAYGIEAMQSEEETRKLAAEAGVLGQTATSVKDVIGYLAGRGDSAMTIRTLLDTLASAGYIDLAPIGNQLGIMISEAVEAKNSADNVTASLEKTGETDASPEVKISGYESASSQVSSLQQQLADLERTYKATVEIDESTSDNGVKSNKISSTKSKGSFAGGTNNAPRGKALVNELGPELISENGQAYIANNGKPAIVDLDKGAIVLDADTTKDVLHGGNSGKKIDSFVSGSKAITLEEFLKNNPAAVVVETQSSQKTKAPVAASGSFKNSGSSGSSGGSSSGSSSSSSSKKEDTWFEKQLKEHKHLLEMDKEEQEDYLKWLNGAYKTAYEQGILDLDDYRKYEEEVYDGLHDVFKEYLSDKEFQIDMLEKQGASAEQIANIYNQMLGDIKIEIDKAYSQGLNDNDDYVQDLWKQWYGYKSDLDDLEKEFVDEAEDNLDDLIQYRIKMINQELNDEKDSYNKRLSTVKDFISRQKELLSDSKSENEYLKEQAKLRKTVSDYENELSQLQYDNSAWAQKRKLELQEELSDARDALTEFETDHALEMTENALDEIYNTVENTLNNQIDLIDEKLDNAKTLYDQALYDVQHNTMELYNEMVAFEEKYESGQAEKLGDIWNNAYDSLKKYFELYGELYKGIDLLDATGHASGISSGAGYASGTYNASAGIHKIFERGDEYTFFRSSSGDTYRMFSGGEKVLNAKATDFLYKFANAGANLGSMTDRMSMLMASPSNNVSSRSSINNFSTGSIIVNGNADDRTVSEIRRAQRDEVNYLLKEFNRLQR